MQYLDRIQDTSVTGGTGTLTLSGTPPSGFRAFSSLTTGVSNIPYCATQGASYEIGIGTLVTSTTFSRDTVLVSSNANVAVDFTTAALTIFNDIPSSEILKLISTSAETTTTVASSATSTLVMIESGGAKQISIDNLIAAIGSTSGSLSPAAALSGTNIITLSQDGGSTLVRTTLSALAAWVLTSGYQGIAAGSSTVLGVGGSLFSAVGVSSGVSDVGGVAAVSGNVGSSSGISTVSGVGVSEIVAAGSSSGVASSAVVGAAAKAAVGASSGSATVEAVGSGTSGPPTYLFSPTAFDFPGESGGNNMAVNGYAGTNPIIWIKTASNTVPANVKMAWSTSSTVAPAVYSDTSVNGHGNGFQLCGHTGSWTDGGGSGQTYWGLFGPVSTLFAWGTPGTWYLWIITDDGFSAPYDNNTGTPVGYTF